MAVSNPRAIPNTQSVGSIDSGVFLSTIGNAIPARRPTDHPPRPISEPESRHKRPVAVGHRLARVYMYWPSPTNPRPMTRHHVRAASSSSKGVFVLITS